MKKKIWIFSVAAALCVCLTVVSYSVQFQSRLSQSVFRLHVLANSDSAADQALKLAVRDRLLSEGRALFGTCRDKADAERVLRENLSLLEEAAQNEVRSAGSPCDVHVSLGKSYFPMKRYAHYTFPAGEYDAVRVSIGAAQGQNWWCVMFPPLCFVDAAVQDDDALASSLGEGDLDVLESADGVDIRLRIVDFVRNSIHTIKTALR